MAHKEVSPGCDRGALPRLLPGDLKEEKRRILKVKTL
jgi:hypothetical protein